MATDKEQTLNGLRSKVLADSNNNEGRLRFAMFSQPPAGVWGDGDYRVGKTKHTREDGKVLTAPRGIFGGITKSGKVESCYFSKSGYVSIGDPYIDPASIERQYQNSRKKKFPHENDFRPSDGTKSDPMKPVFKHLADHNEVKKNYRGPDGKVISNPRNITSNPSKVGHGDTTVGHLFAKTLPHLADPYDRMRLLKTKEREEHKKKLQEAPFRSVSHGGENFTNSKRQFGKDGQCLKPGPLKAIENKGKMHEAAFRPANPSKYGYNKTIGKFPEYKEDPIRQAVRKHEDASGKRDPFRPNDTGFNIRPSPSVSLNRGNLKNEMARITSM
jgi:hypothetical protein